MAIRDHAPGTRELYVRVLGYFTDWLRGGHRADALSACDTINPLADL